MKFERIVRKTKRLLRNPFQQNSERIILHCAHHRCGSTWFQGILKTVAKEYGLPFIQEDQSKIENYPCVFYQDHSHVDLTQLENYRGSHMIRDPRDVVVSGYYYHLWTEEKWANTPIRELGPNIALYWPLLPIGKIKDMSYRGYLNSVDREEGILAETKRASSTDIKDMVEWDYTNEKILELKYEAIIEDEERAFERLFEHYGFHTRAVKRSLAIARRHSFKKKTRRNIGEIKNKSHLRSGRSKQWENEFSEMHKEYFKKLHGADLIKLGYEGHMNW